MIELDILIEELELSNMSRVSKKYIYENLIDIRQEITKQLTLTDVGCSCADKEEIAFGKGYNLGAKEAADEICSKI